MGYFENLAETAFKTGANGETHFNRSGIFGMPYIVPDSGRKEEIKRFIVNYYKIALSIGLVSGILLRWWALLIALLMILYYEIKIRQKIAGLPRSSEKLTLGQAYANSSKVYPPAFLWFGAICSGLFVLAGLLILWKTDKVWQGVSSVVFFGLCLMAYIRMLLERKKASRQ